MKKALFVWGGWAGHQPRECAELMASVLEREGFQVELANTLDVFLDKEKLAGLSLIVPVWTMGELTSEQGTGLLAAVQAGVGLGGWHGGMGDAFRVHTSYQWMVGGQFVAHPGGIIEYAVHIAQPDHPIVRGLHDFKITSEQYYMHVDPTNNILATTTVHSKEYPWIDGCVMPAVWTRPFGAGRVFYSSLGHVATDFNIPEVLEITKRGLVWASR